MAEPSKPLRSCEDRRWYEWVGPATLLLLICYIIWKLIRYG